MTSERHIDQFFLERGFGQKVGFGQRPAVIVIDFMCAFTNPNLPLGGNLEREMAETKRVVEAARSAGVPIYYTVVYYDEDNMADAGVWKQKMKGVSTLRAGTPEVELDPRCGYQPGETVLLKKYASSFFGTDLVSRLTSRGVDTLILTGCTTSGCVRATAVDGLQYGFHVIVAEEAVGDRAEAAHKQSLFDLNAKYADVVSVSEVLEYLEGLRQPAEAVPVQAARR
jgi:nicotinamidase-related amidase